MVLSEFDGERGLRKHPLCSSWGSELFVGAPIMLDDEVWGSVSFSSRTIRTKPFDASVMRMLAAGAEEIAAAHQIANPAALARAQVDLGAAIKFEPKEALQEEEPLPGCIIPLPLPRARPRIPVGTV